MSTDQTPEQVEAEVLEKAKKYVFLTAGDKIKELEKKSFKVVASVTDVNLAVVGIEGKHYIRSTMGGDFITINNLLYEFDLAYDACAMIGCFIEEAQQKERIKQAMAKRKRNFNSTVKGQHNEYRAAKRKAKDKKRKKRTRKMKRKGKKK